MHHCKSYNELKISGPPLYKQGCISDNSTQEPNNSTSCPSNFPPLNPSTTALLIVDVQPEYWSECPAVRKDFPHFPSNISSLVVNCREQNVKRIIWVRAAYNYQDSPWLHQFSRLHEGRIPDVVENTCEWEEFAKPLGDEMVITKTSWSSTSGNTGLLDVLKKDGIEAVLVCGLITSVCVQHSAFGVFEAGYRTILVTDACADRGMERHVAALALYGNYMYELRMVHCLEADLKRSNALLHCDECECNEDEKGGVTIKQFMSNGSLTSETSIDDSVSTVGEDQLYEQLLVEE